MNTMPDSIIVNSCQYTPVYLIQNPGTTQMNSYFLAQSNHEERKPISDNLKTFYENSGNIENSVRNVNNSPKPRILKKQDSGSIGNNLKLASFLLPKNDNINKQYIVNNLILKPTETVTTSNTGTTNTLPKFDFDSKIVKLKDVPITTRKTLPKIKPKEITPVPNPSKLTSVQLIKLGETYHSLNQLSDEQMKMVNQALKIFSDPEKIAPEPTYDPVTNTKFIYKVVSPRDLTVVGKNKIKEKKIDPKKDCIKKTEEKVTKYKVQECKHEREPSPPVEPKVTRSGRKVKLPKQSLPDDTPHRPKKKNTIVTCFQCSAEFTSLYRLQKHYENHPTHIPGRVHSNLFNCLLAIIKSGSEEDRKNIFIQQLEELIVKLRSLLPCLLKTNGRKEEKSCTINEDVGRLFGINPGAYSLDINALYCVKNESGNCKHNPAKPESSELKMPQLWIPIDNKDAPNAEMETEDCARINSVEKWPNINKRIWKLKNHKSQENPKRKRLASENCDTLIELGMEDLVTFSKPNEANDESIIAPQNDRVILLENESNYIDQPEITSVEDQSKKTECNNHAQFHSAHFDIRSSPIKSSSTVFRKFQINPEKLANCEVKIIRSLDMVKKDDKEKDIPTQNTENALQEIFKENSLSSKDSFTIDRELKDWILNRSNDDKSEDSFTKCNSLIEPALIHIKDNENKLPENNDTNDLQSNDIQNESVLNFLDTLSNTCLSYPGTEIRTNNVDFPLDLFSFHNS